MTRRTARALLLGGAVLLGGGPALAATYAYVSNADSQDISVLRLDPATGELQAIETVPLGGTVTPLALSPDRRFLYAGLRSQPYRVLSFAVDAEGRLRKLGEASLADAMAYLSTDRSGRWLFGASYPGHKITVNAIGKDGTVGAVQQLAGTGRNAHAVQADAANRHVLATSLGSDQVSSWHFDAATGTLTPNATALTELPAQAGPRHFIFDRAQRFAYVLGEDDGKLYVLAYDAAQGTLRQTQAVSVLPPGFSGAPLAADLHLTPDGRFLYASERSSSTLALFKVDADSGALQPLGHAATEKTPHGFGIDPSGRYLLAAGQDANSLAVHAIDANTGALSLLKRYAVGKSPKWVEFVERP